MRRIKRQKEHQLIEFELDEGLIQLWAEREDASYEEFCQEPGDASRAERWQCVSACVERYPRDLVSIDVRFLVTENATLRALSDLGVPIVARWVLGERSHRRYDPIPEYRLSGYCVQCNAPLSFVAYDWEPPFLRLEEYLSDAMRCEHAPQVELDEQQLESMILLELLADPG